MWRSKSCWSLTSAQRRSDASRIPTASSTERMADPAEVEAALQEKLGDDARQWIESILGDKLPSQRDQGLHAALRDGIALCALVRKIQPGICQKPSLSNKPFQQMENIAAYLRACELLGVPSHDLFMTIDLFEARDMKAVTRCASDHARRAVQVLTALYCHARCSVVCHTQCHHSDHSSTPDITTSPSF